MRLLDLPTARLYAGRLPLHHLRPAHLGKSRNTDEAQQPGYQDEDLHGLVEFLGLDRFHIIGTAAGGITAIGYALAHPERVRSLVFANTIAGIQDPEYLEVQDRIRPPEIRNLPVELYELGPSYRGTDPDGTARWLEIERASRPYGRLPAQPLREPTTYARLATMSVPAMALAGEADLVSPPALMRLQAERIRGSRFVSLPEAGPRRFLGAPAGVERPGAGVHRATLTSAGRNCSGLWGSHCERSAAISLAQGSPSGSRC